MTPEEQHKQLVADFEALAARWAAQCNEGQLDVDMMVFDLVMMSDLTTVPDLIESLQSHYALLETETDGLPEIPPDVGRN